MVKRRKVLIGAGSLLAGGAAATGTGAFNNATLRDRDIKYKLDRDDKNSFVGFTDDAGAGVENGGYVSLPDVNEEKIELTLFEGSGGMNYDSVFFIDNAFAIYVNKNKTPNTANKYEVSLSTQAPGIQFYEGDSQNPSLTDERVNPTSTNDATSGGDDADVVLVGIRVDTDNLPEQGVGKKTAGTFDITVDEV